MKLNGRVAFGLTMVFELCGAWGCVAQSVPVGLGAAAVARAATASVVWTAGPSLPVGRAKGKMVRVADGSVVAIGGDLGLADATLVHGLGKGSTTWGVLGNLDAPRFAQGAIAVADGTVLQFGGREQDNILADTYTYDPASANINTLPGMGTARADFASAFDGLGRAYAFGGQGNGAAIYSVERFDPATRSWSTLRAMAAPCVSCAAAWDGNDSIFLFPVPGARSSATMRYTISTDVWTAAAAPPVVVSNSVAVLGADQRIYVLGGIGYGSQPTANVMAYDPLADTWTMETALPVAVFSAQAALDGFGQIVVAGGYDASGVAVAGTWHTQVLQAQDAVPSITSTAVTGAVVGVPYSYTLRASGYPAPVFTVNNGPGGLTVSPAGVVSWLPGAGDVGSVTVEIAATNLAGSTTQRYTLTVLPPVPPTPTGLRVTGITTTTVTLAWNPVTYGFRPLTYTIYLEVFGTGRFVHISWDPVATGITGTTYKLTGLKPGSAYNYKVASVSPGGPSIQSAPVSAVTLLPGTPTGLAATKVTRTSATLTWKMGVGTTPTATYAVYSIYGGLVQSGIATTRFVLTNLTPATTTYYYVIGYDAGGVASAASTYVAVTTLK